MKLLLYFALLLFLVSCQSPGSKNHSQEIKDSLSSPENTASVQAKDTTIQLHTSVQAVMYQDSIVYPDVKQFKQLRQKLTSISQRQYEDIKKRQTIGCDMDSNGFMVGKGLRYHQTCDEVCESYLTDEQSGIRMFIPSNYDGGISGMLLSPQCKKFAVYSSYDGTDYSNYYEYRSEFYTFQVLDGKGIQVMQPAFVYHTKSFSIAEIIWVDENTLALKTYRADRYAAGKTDVAFQYYQALLTAN